MAMQVVAGGCRWSLPLKECRVPPEEGAWLAVIQCDAGAKARPLQVSALPAVVWASSGGVGWTGVACSGWRGRECASKRVLLAAEGEWMGRGRV